MHIALGSVSRTSARVVHMATDFLYVGPCTDVASKVVFYDPGPCPSSPFLSQDQHLVIGVFGATHETGKNDSDPVPEL